MSDEMVPTLHNIDVTPFLDLMLMVAGERSVDGIIERVCSAYPGSHITFGGLWFRDNLPISNSPDPRAQGAHNRLRLRAEAGESRIGIHRWRHEHGDYRLVPLNDPVLTPAFKGGPFSLGGDKPWERPQWAVDEGFHAFSTYPIRYRDDCLGVMAVFYGRPMTGRLADMMRMHRKMHRIFADTLGAVLSNAMAFEEIQRLRRELELENEHLRRAVRTAQHGDDDIVGDSKALGHIMEQIEVVAPTDASVLILGESGTGKELLAQAIHKRSRRRSGPLVRVNCSAIPRGLFESEFFGHVKGSFTGAVKDRTGRFQMADGGTLFLDEVGEIPLDLQGKLLRVLQEGTFEPIGDDRSRTVDVRILAATNKDLAAEVEAGNFRQDLYFRLSVFPIHNPSLRERREDIPLLARHFIDKAARRLGIEAPRLHFRQIARLQEYDWPGNVRELQNIVERAVIMAHGGVLEFNLPTPGTARQPIRWGELTPQSPMQAPHLFSAGSNKVQSLQNIAPIAQFGGDEQIVTEQQWEQMQRENIIKALSCCNWRVQGEGGAAELLGVKPTTLQSRIKKMGITRPR